MLINTSLNGPGDPLTETPEQSIDTLRNTGMHALAMPPYLIRKRAEPPVPGEDWERPAAPDVSGAGSAAGQMSRSPSSTRTPPEERTRQRRGERQEERRRPPAEARPGRARARARPGRRG